MKVRIDAAAWRAADVDLLAFDRLVHQAERAPPVELDVVGEGADEAAAQARLRWQRLWPARNEASSTPLFDRVLAAHRDLHDLSKPLVRADFDHALDVWQWTLRLQPRASLVVQLAALFHDVERLVSEADFRVEQHAADYQAFKDAHAKKGAATAESVLIERGVAVDVAAGARELIVAHERRHGQGDAALLTDADALSFFALNSAGYLAYFGPAQTDKKVRWTLDRMSDAARAWLPRVRLPPRVEAIVRGAA